MELFVQLATEQRNERSDGIDRMTTVEMLRMINGEDRSVAGAVERVIPQIAAAVDAIYGCSRNGGRLFYVGAGTSGRLGVLDACDAPPRSTFLPNWSRGSWRECPLSARATEASEDDPQAGARDMLSRGFASGRCALRNRSQRTDTLRFGGCVAEAKKMGAVTVGLSCGGLGTGATPITPVTGPEVITGCRSLLKAGTATKLVLNMITTSGDGEVGHDLR